MFSTAPALLLRFTFFCVGIFIGNLPESRYFLLAFYQYFRVISDLVIFLRPWWQPCWFSCRYWYWHLCCYRYWYICIGSGIGGTVCTQSTSGLLQTTPGVGICICIVVCIYICVCICICEDTEASL